MRRNIFCRMLNLQKGEFVLLLCSFIFMFLIFASYGILRPVRDALGLENGSENLKWLFLATFVTMILFSLLAMWLSGFVKRKFYIECIFIFFTLNLLCFYVAMRAIPDTSSYFIHLSSVFYVWVSIFSLFIISSAWSLLVDIYSKERSQRLFGIIIAGVSLGGIVGAATVISLKQYLQTPSFILISMLLLALALVFKHFIISEAFQLLSKSDDSSNPLDTLQEHFNKPISSKNPFSGFSLIIKSPYLMAFMGFILLLTSVSTFLYLEQSRVIQELFPKNMEGYKETRASIFASIDLIVQSVSFFIQFFLTSRIVKFIGLKWLLSSLGVVIAVGFVWLAFVHSTSFSPASEPYILSILGMDFNFYPHLLPIAVVMSLRRIGEYALIRPGREMLFVPLDSESKYKVKNFLDTVVYRAGDSLSAQVEGAIAQVSIMGVLFVGAKVSLVWSGLGWYLGKKYETQKR
ncbi:NTP/NDP exchange transporter [Helicobacter himalayensis]|uniref:NTP/NDP exchange transporter n=1 Tax=Helicobacter himalayensis TaxID=1591088 RepID=UPI003D6DCF99